MKSWQKILIRVLYMTPIGYILGLSSFLSGGNLQGLKIIPFRDREDGPIVTMTENPFLKDRLIWFINGVFLFIQGWFATEFYFKNRILEEFTSFYAVLAFLFGFIAIFSAIFPRLPWNKKLF